MRKKILPIIGAVVLALLLVPRRADIAPAFSPLTLYSGNGISVTLQDASTSGLMLHIDNQSAENIHVYGESAVINGFTFPALLMQDVYTDKTANTEIHIDPAALEAANVSTIADMSLYIHITGESGSDIYSGRVGAAIDSTYSQPVDSSGVIVYSTDDYFIAARAYDLDTPSCAALIYVENNTDNRLSLTCNSLSINGVMLDGMFTMQNVEPHTRAQFVLDTHTLSAFNNSSSGVSHVDDMSIQLGLTPWSGSSFSTIGTIETDAVQIIGA